MLPASLRIETLFLRALLFPHTHTKLPPLRAESGIAPRLDSNKVLPEAQVWGSGSARHGCAPLKPAAVRAITLF